MSDTNDLRRIAARTRAVEENRPAEYDFFHPEPFFCDILMTEGKPENVERFLEFLRKKTMTESFAKDVTRLLLIDHPDKTEKML